MSQIFKIIFNIGMSRFSKIILWKRKLLYTLGNKLTVLCESIAKFLKFISKALKIVFANLQCLICLDL